MNKKNVKRENQNSYHPYGAISNIEASKKTRIEDGLNNNAGTSNSAGKSPIIELNDPNSNRAGTTSLGGQQQYKILNDNNSEGVADEEIHIKNATMWSVSPKELSVFCRVCFSFCLFGYHLLASLETCKAE
jgi:hypothetical protein